jgi:hypothetical protein
MTDIITSRDKCSYIVGAEMPSRCEDQTGMLKFCMEYFVTGQLTFGGGGSSFITVVISPDISHSP